MVIRPRSTHRPLFKTKNIDSSLAMYIIPDEIFSQELGIFFI
jgi:hypothetical protein